MATPQTNIEVKMKLLADAKQASASVKGLSGDVSNLSKSTQDASGNLQRLGNAYGRAGSANKAAGSGAGPSASSPGSPNVRRDFDGLDKFRKPEEAAEKAGAGLTKLAGSAAAAVVMMTALAKAAGAGATAYYSGKGTVGILDATLANTPIVGSAYTGIKGGITSSVFSKSMAAANLSERATAMEEGRNALFGPIDRLEGARKLQDEQQKIRTETAQAAAPDRAANRAKYGERFEDAFNEAEYAANKARRELQISDRGNTAASDAAVKAAKEANMRRDEVAKAEKAVKNAPNGAAELAARSELQAAESNLARALEAQRAASERAAKSSLDLVEKQRASLAAETALIGAKRDRAKTLLDETKTSAASFMASTDEDKYMLAAAMRQMKEGGVESLAPEQKQLLLGNGITGEMTKKNLVESAKDDPMLNSILKDTGRGTIREQEKEVQKLNAEFDAKVKLDDQQIEDAFRKALAEAGLDAESIAKKLASSGNRELENKLSQQAIGQGLGVR